MKTHALPSLMLLASLILPSACTNPPNPDEPTSARSDGRLQPATEASLTRWFQRAQSANRITTELSSDGNLASGDASQSSATPAAGAFSSTTLQETGVDEADQIKTDGQYLYALYRQASDTVFPADTAPSKPAIDHPRQTEQGIRIMQTLDGSPALREASRITLPDTAGIPRGLYLTTDNQTLIALSSGNDHFQPDWFFSGGFAQQATRIYWIDVSNPAVAAITHQLDFEGALVASRKIKDTLYLVLRHYPRIATNAGDTGKPGAAPLEASGLLPRATLDDQPSQPAVSAEHCYIQPDNPTPGADIITLIAINLKTETPAFNSLCYVGASEALYASTRALYLATTRWQYRIEGDIAFYDPRTTTDIHKFALDGTQLNYRGSAEIVGHLGYQQDRKSFRMSESADGRYFRILTYNEQRPWLQTEASPGQAAGTAGTSPQEKTDSSPVMLSILEEAPDRAALKIVSQLPNNRRPTPIGAPGEQLYASRFIGDRAYLVTFRTTDPLYILDLADPADPFVAGALKVDGYSDFLFSVNPNLILGLGKDAVFDPDNLSSFRGGAWYQGLKLSLIDISDPSRPRETDKVILGKRGSESEALHDHHALTRLREAASGITRIALPVELHDTPISATNGPSTYYGYTQSGLYRFEIDPTAQTIRQLPSLISHRHEQNKLPPISSGNRSVLIGDNIHFLQNGKFWSQDWAGQTGAIGPQ